MENTNFHAIALFFPTLFFFSFSYTTTFHSINRRTTAQGGDPTGTGRGGQSIWGGKFPDEIRDTLKHTNRGILSMANSGSNANNSQFFITYAKAPHLNGKNTIFGKVIDGRGRGHCMPLSRNPHSRIPRLLSSPPQHPLPPHANTLTHAPHVPRSSVS